LCLGNPEAGSLRLDERGQGIVFPWKNERNWIALSQWNGNWSCADRQIRTKAADTTDNPNLLRIEEVISASIIAVSRNEKQSAILNSAGTGEIAITVLKKINRFMVWG
jgi:hypothetical protein